MLYILKKGNVKNKEMTLLPIEVKGNRAIISVNPGAELKSFVDKWDSRGYVASIGVKDELYVVGKVIYDLQKVAFEKVQEVAKKFSDGSFQCPACQRMAESVVEKKVEASFEESAGEIEREGKGEVVVIREIVNALDQLILRSVLIGAR